MGTDRSPASPRLDPGAWIWAPPADHAQAATRARRAAYATLAPAREAQRDSATAPPSAPGAEPDAGSMPQAWDARGPVQYPLGPPPAAAADHLAALAAGPEAGLAAWRARCRANWQALADALRGAPGVVPFHSTLPTQVCPLGFVVRHPDRGVLAARLLRRGVEATLHWPVPAEARPFLRRAERLLAGTILTLPCDGRYGPADMERVARAVREAGAPPDFGGPAPWVRPLR